MFEYLLPTPYQLFDNPGVDRMSTHLPHALMTQLQLHLQRSFVPGSMTAVKASASSRRSYSGQRQRSLTGSRRIQINTLPPQIAINASGSRSLSFLPSRSSKPSSSQESRHSRVQSTPTAAESKLHKELLGVVKSFEAPIGFAFGYGSGVFPQEGYDLSEGAEKVRHDTSHWSTRRHLTPKSHSHRST